MHVFITGATGLIGRRLVLDRLERGDQVRVLSRSRRRAVTLFAAGANPNVEVIEGDPAVPGPWQQAIDGCDAVVHLAGASIAGRRWTTRYKKEIVDSRIDSTFQVVEAIRAAASPPRVLVNASAIACYGDTGAREVDEQSDASCRDFLGELVARWEAEAMQAQEVGARVVTLRNGIVLDDRGGALAQMARPFRLFVGGPIGLGRQYMSWIHWRDLVALVDLALTDERVRGPLNGTAPNPVRNRAFSRALGAALGRPSWLPVPRFAVRLAVGELARFITMSQRIVSGRARVLGHRFIYPEIGPALQSLYRSPDNASAPAPAAALARAHAGATDGATDGARTAASPVRLLAIGVDGTLLRSDGRLPQSVLRRCRAARRAGCVIVLATSRPPRFVSTLVRTLELDGPLIAYNGAVIWNPLEGHAQYHEPLDGALGMQIVEAARAVEPDLIVGVEVLDQWFTDRLDPALVAAGDRRAEPDGLGPLSDCLSGPVTQLNLYGAPEQVQRVRPTIEAHFWRPRAIGLFPAGPSLLQVTHPLADKSIALQRIAQRLGVDRAAVMAIGDASNDKGMIEWAGLGIVTANATADARAIADAVVPSNDDHGVAVAIQRYVLGG